MLKIEVKSKVWSCSWDSQLKYEDKSDTKFKFATFNKNVNRVKAATAGFDPELAIRELKYAKKYFLQDW